MTAKNDAVIGIASFNSAETISSCRLWRRKVVTNAAAYSFRSSGSLAVACSAIRRRAIHLSRQLGLRLDLKNPKSPKAMVCNDDFTAIHELIRLVGNVTFFDLLCRLTVKDTDVVQHLGILLEYSDLKLDIATAIIRLFGNLCESKESAAAVLQTKPCVRMIVHWLTKHLDDDLEHNLIDDSTESKSSVNNPPATDRIQYEKLREHCVRALRNAASCGKNFGQYLIRTEAVYAVGRCLRLLDGVNEATGLRDNSFQLLQLLLPFKDHNYSQQLLRADILEKLMNAARSGSDMAATKLVLGMVIHYSSLRCDLSKFGVIEWINERMENMISKENWPDQVSKGELSPDGETLIALIRFCRDAYTRGKLRESRALDLLLNIFVGDDLKETKLLIELMSAFLCFLYDDQGLKYLVEYNGFLTSVVRIVGRFTSDFSCSAMHFSKTDDKGLDEEDSSTTDTGMDPPLCEFRPDSPSYKRFRLDPTVANINRDGEMNLFDGPLCKDFSSAVLHSNSWSSHSSPFRSAPSPSSPGPAWSPSASSLHSISSVGSMSPPAAGDRSGNSSCWSPASDGYRSTDDNEFDYLEFNCNRRFSNCSQDQSPPALCECETPSADESSYKDRERLIWSVVRLISWLSHSAHASLLVKSEHLTVLLSYIAGVCRPEPRVGRLIERLTRNRLFTESLLQLSFHQKIYDALCISKCGNGNEPKKQCCRCRKLSKIGSGILKSFRAQVDTDFGFGTLEHIMASGDDTAKLHCLCAMLYLMKSNWRIRRLMSGEHGGLHNLVSVLASNESVDEARAITAKSLYAAIDKEASRVRLKWSSATSATQSSDCTFESAGGVTDENRVTFLEKDGEGKIDCNVEVLVALSPFYRAMFSGFYSESNRRHFVCDDDNVNSNFSSFTFYIHFLHGCRNCGRAMLNSAADCLSVLELADKRLCCSLGEFVVNNVVTKFFNLDNVEHFISNSILRRDLVLYKLCMDFVFVEGNFDDFLHIATVFRTSSLGVEFFLMLCNYLKAELQFE